MSTAHIRYRKPSFDDLRWQVNTSLAYGAKGIMYFTLYTPANLVGWNYRQRPLNWWGERTELFYSLRDVNRELHERWGDLFTEMGLISVSHYPKAPDACLSTFDGSGTVKELKIHQGYEPNVIVSEFIHEPSDRKYIFVINANTSDSLWVQPLLKDVKKVSLFTALGEIQEVSNSTQFKDHFEFNLILAPSQGELCALD